MTSIIGIPKEIIQAIALIAIGVGLGLAFMNNWAGWIIAIVAGVFLAWVSMQ